MPICAIISEQGMQEFLPKSFRWRLSTRESARLFSTRAESLNRAIWLLWFLICQPKAMILSAKTICAHQNSAAHQWMDFFRNTLKSRLKGLFFFLRISTETLQRSPKLFLFRCMQFQDLIKSLIQEGKLSASGATVISAI